MPSLMAEIVGYLSQRGTQISIVVDISGDVGGYDTLLFVERQLGDLTLQDVPSLKCRWCCRPIRGL